MNGRIRLIGWTGLLSEVDWMKEAAQLSSLVGVTGSGIDGHILGGAHVRVMPCPLKLSDRDFGGSKDVVKLEVVVNNRYFAERVAPSLRIRFTCESLTKRRRL